MRHLQSELLLAPIKTVKSECFATQNAIVTGAGAKPALVLWSKRMDNIKLYEVDAKYVNYLTAFDKASHPSIPGWVAFLLRPIEPSGSVVCCAFSLQPLDLAGHSVHIHDAVGASVPFNFPDALRRAKAALLCPDTSAKI